MIVRLTQRRVTGFKETNKDTAQCPRCIVLTAVKGVYCVTGAYVWIGERRKRIVVNSHGSSCRVLVRMFQGEVKLKSSYTRHAFGRRGMLEFNTRVQENTRPHKLATTTDEHLDPTKHQQGWRFDLVSSWRRGHTRGSRQDIHSTRVPGSPGRLRMAHNQTTAHTPL